jgi:hypothetical protein
LGTLKLIGVPAAYRDLKPTKSENAIAAIASATEESAMFRLTALLSVLLTAPCYADSWTCTAPGLVSGSYDGGDSAYIHLSGFSDGKSYPVKKSGNRATGTTTNGTKFTCSKR